MTPGVRNSTSIGGRSPPPTDTLSQVRAIHDRHNFQSTKLWIRSINAIRVLGF